MSNYFDLQNAAILTTPSTLTVPKISGITIADSGYQALDDTAVSTSGGYVIINGTGFAAGCTVLIGTQIATSVSFVNSTTVRAQVPAQAAGSYTVYLTNSDGGVAIRINGLNYSATPTWTTTSPLPTGIIDTPISIQLAATSNTAVTYALQSGSTLPTGLTLTSAGLLSGSVSNIQENTTYNFTVVAIDQELQDTPRALSITISIADPYFNQTALLVSADGTNAANNNTFLDSSTNNFTITRNGNTAQGTFSPYGGGWSNYFDGGTNRLTTGTSSQFNLSGASITLECWVYMTATASVFNRLITIGANNAQSSLFLGFDTARTAIVSVPFTSGGTVTSGSTVVALNTWTHIAFVLNGSTGTLYLNGTQVGQTAGWSITSGNSNYFYVGYDSTATVDAKYTGYVSNVRLLVGTALYSGSSFAVPTSPLTPITNTRILVCADNRFIDDSANNFAIGVAGSVTTQRFNPFGAVTTTPKSYSGYFDGSGDMLTVADNTGFDLSSGDFTVECWVMRTGDSGAYTEWVCGKREAGGGYRWSWNTGIDGSSKFYFGNGATAVTSTTSIAYNTWYHTAAVRSGSTITLYINGTAEATGTMTINNYASNLTIGNYPVDNPNFTGYISNLRVVKGSAVYTGNFTSSTTPLTAVTNTALLTLQSPTFTDNSTNNFAITISGDTAPRQLNPFGSTNSATVYGANTYGGSAYFDGTGDWLTIPYNVNLVPGSENFTIEMWFYTTNGSTRQDPYSMYTSTTGIGIALSLTAARDIVVYNGDTTLLATAGSVWAVNTWNHLVISRSGTALRIFVNGTQVGTATNSTNITGSTTMYIGAAGNASLPFTGYLSNVRFVKGTAVYTSNFTPPVAPVTAITNTSLLLNFTNASIIDSAMISDIETVGNAQISTAQSKFGGASLYFDGTGDYLVTTDSPAFEPGAGNLTWEMWINTTSSTQYATLYSKTPANFASGMWTLMINMASATSGDVGVYVANYSGASPLLQTTGVNVRDGAWHHIAVTRNGSSWVLYVDGISRATATWSGTIADIAGSPYIGADQFYSRHFAGYMDDVRITNGIARYTANFTPPTGPHPQK